MWAGGQRLALRLLYSGERACIHCTGGQVGNRASLDGGGKSRITGIRSPNRPARSCHMTAYLTRLVREFLFHSS